MLLSFFGDPSGRQRKQPLINYVITSPRFTVLNIHKLDYLDVIKLCFVFGIHGQFLEFYTGNI